MTATRAKRASLIEDQLGMSYGKANSQLKKQLMLNLLQQLGKDQCLRCKLTIQTAVELSVDHKEPWYKVSPELFWDLSNVAFSHRTCNKVDRPATGSNSSGYLKRQVAPTGLLWCANHKKHLPESLFVSNKARWTGKATYCRECSNTLRKKYKSRQSKRRMAGTVTGHTANVKPG